MKTEKELRTYRENLREVLTSFERCGCLEYICNISQLERDIKMLNHVLDGDETHTAFEEFIAARIAKKKAEESSVKKSSDLTKGNTCNN